MQIEYAEQSDVRELYSLQQLAFKTEAAMIGSDSVPALLETAEENAADFNHWTTLKLMDGNNIIGSIRYRPSAGKVEVGRLMIHPDYRRQGLAQKMLKTMDQECPGKVKELYTCTKSWTNIKLYRKMGYRPTKEVTEKSGLSFVYMDKK